MTEAERLVIEDERRSYPDATETECLDNARNRIGPEHLDPPGTDPLSDAYREVLGL